MAQVEASFKVCGLCSQVVDESVQLNETLRDFLINFLIVDATDLPAKVCTDCYQGAVDSKKFKEKCVRAVDKLKKTDLSDSMILGRSIGEMKAIKQLQKPKAGKVKNPPPPPPVPPVEESPAPATTGRSSRRSVNTSLGKAINESIESVFEPIGTRKSSRSRTKTTEAVPESSQNEEKVMLPSVVLSNKDRERAESYLGLRSRTGRPLKRKTPYSPPKVPEATPASTSRSKRARGVLNQSEVSTPQSDSKTPQNSAATKSSRKASTQSQNVKTKKEDEKDASKKGGNTVQYYVDDGGAPAAQPEIIDVEDGEEEIFPSLGPYQCEICQAITDTKQEFVAHIKALHKDMVDEAVLRSLESDLKKRRKKEAIDGNKGALKQKSKELENGKKPKKSGVVPQAVRSKKRTSKVDDDDDEYRPGGKKKHRKLSGKSSPKKGAKTGPIDCPICGSTVRESELAKHQATLRCRTAAYNLATTKATQGTEDPVEGGTETLATVRQLDKGKSSDVEGNSNCSMDAKFKANIAKRYEAERESGETGNDAVKEETSHERKHTDSTSAVAVDTSQYVTDPDEDLPIDDEDTDAAIKAAMQESLGSTGDENMSDSHSPAAYIDPTPQPDMESPHSPLPDKQTESEHFKDSRPQDISRPRDSLDTQMAALHGAAGSFPSPPFNMNGSMNYMY